MMRRLAILFALGLLMIAGAGSGQSLVTRYVAGEHYKAIDESVAQPDDGKIHVVEFFLYSCPHCFHLEPELNDWRAQLGDDVEFSRVPVLFGNGGRIYARLYYTAQKLGVLGQVHEDIFNAIHEQGRRLQSENAIRAFMKNHGVGAKRFNAAFNSDAVKTQVRKARQTMRAFRVRATPSLGVAGRYYISGRTAGSNAKMFDVADYLISQQQKKTAE